MSRRTSIGARAVALLLLAGCSALPVMPAPVPTSVVPTDLPQQVPTSSGNLSPDGFDAAQRMAVRIRNIGCGTLATGSGFALDDHTLVTNKHVVADSSTLQVSTYDGRDLAAAAASSADLADLAIVRTEDALPTAPELAAADPAVGALVTVVGYPLGRALTVTPGRCSASRPILSTRTWARSWSPMRPWSTAARDRPCSTARAASSASCTPRTRTVTALWCP